MNVYLNSIFLPVAEVAMDPFFALLSRNWAEIGGWSLFISLCILIVLGAFREWWVPGARIQKLERLIESQEVLIKEQSQQIGQLVTANEISKYFFEETVPKRGEPKT